MAKKKKYFIPEKMGTMDRITLALAFVGEHKELFEQWIKEKGGTVKK